VLVKNHRQDESSGTSGELAHPKYRADIDGLRAVAVLSVVGFHAFQIWIRGGFIGGDNVDHGSDHLVAKIARENGASVSPIGSMTRNAMAWWNSMRTTRL